MVDLVWEKRQNYPENKRELRWEREVVYYCGRD
jgi:hypothetical protein